MDIEVKDPKSQSETNTSQQSKDISQTQMQEAKDSSHLTQRVAPDSSGIVESLSETFNIHSASKESPAKKSAVGFTARIIPPPQSGTAAVNIVTPIISPKIEPQVNVISKPKNEKQPSKKSLKQSLQSPEQNQQKGVRFGLPQGSPLTTTTESPSPSSSSKRSKLAKFRTVPLHLNVNKLEGYSLEDCKALLLQPTRSESRLRVPAFMPSDRQMKKRENTRAVSFSAVQTPQFYNEFIKKTKGQDVEALKKAEAEEQKRNIDQAKLDRLNALPVGNNDVVFVRKTPKKDKPVHAKLSFDEIQKRLKEDRERKAKEADEKKA